jgi:hypothetical protein
MAKVTAQLKERFLAAVCQSGNVTHAAEGPKSPGAVAAALDLRTARDFLRRMAAHGVLTKPAPGRYAVASPCTVGDT